MINLPVVVGDEVVIAADAVVGDLVLVDADVDECHCCGKNV